MIDTKQHVVRVRISGTKAMMGNHPLIHISVGFVGMLDVQHVWPQAW